LEADTPPIKRFGNSDQIDDPKYRDGDTNDNTYAATNHCIPSRVVRNVSALAPGSPLSRYYGPCTSHHGDDADENKKTVLAINETVCAHRSHFPSRVTLAAPMKLSASGRKPTWTPLESQK
jgi:hypothetical protein